MKAEGFVKIDNWQWISEQEIVPEEIIPINVRDYWETVTFSEEARRINAILYGEMMYTHEQSDLPSIHD